MTGAGALANNGGTTQTIELESGNPAIGIVPTATPTYCPAGGVTDQRGQATTAGQPCDAGAAQYLQAQATSFTSAAPAGATYSGSNSQTYAVTATGGGGAHPVTFTIDASSTSGCTISGSTVSYGGAGGTCVIDANQAGNADYAAAPQVEQSFAGSNPPPPPNPSPTSTSLTSSTATAAPGVSVTFTVSVISLGLAPAGTVTSRPAASYGSTEREQGHTMAMVATPPSDPFSRPFDREARRGPSRIGTTHPHRQRSATARSGRQRALPKPALP